MLRTLACSSILCFVISAGTAFAQTPAPSQPAGAATTPKTDKQSISKACSDQANAKGLHGKERKKFRSECKKSGGKST
jgi:hypothetical protein